MKIYENLRCKELKDLSDDALRLEAKLHIEKYGNSDKVFDYSILDHPIPFD